MKIYYLIFFILVIFFLGLKNSIAADNKFNPSFLIFFELPGCISCNTAKYNDIISDINKRFPNSNIVVFVEVDDIIQFHPKIKEIFNTTEVYPDTGRKLKDYLE